MKLAEALLHALKDHGARELFGIPGDFALPFFKVIEESGILPLYTLSHERGALRRPGFLFRESVPHAHLLQMKRGMCNLACMHSWTT